MRGRLAAFLPALTTMVRCRPCAASARASATAARSMPSAPLPARAAVAAPPASSPSTSSRETHAWTPDTRRRRQRRPLATPSRRGAASAAVPAGQADAHAHAHHPSLAHLLPSAPLRLAPGEVHLWWADAADPGLSPDLVRAYADALLTPAEAAAAGGQPGRVLARALVRATLARYCGGDAGADPRALAFRTSARGGKPALEAACNPAGVEFNLTHSGGLAGVAVGGPGSGVGLDVEAAARAPRSGSAAVAARHFAPAEAAALAALAASDGDAAATAEFVRLWTLKESFVKATGDGIRGAGVGVRAAGAAAAGCADPAGPAASTRGLASFTLALEPDGPDGRAAAALAAALPGLPLVGGGGRRRVGAGDATLTGAAAAVRAIRFLDGGGETCPWRFVLLRPRPGFVASLCVRREGGGQGRQQRPPPPLRVRAWQGLPGRPAAPLPTGAAGLACSVPL